MNISKLNYLLLAVCGLTFVALCSTIQCMQVPERNDGFEAVVKRGYYDFLNMVGQEKFKELGLEEAIEEKIKEEKPSIETKLTIPLAAQGHESIYQRFLNGVLIYRPQKGCDDGMVRLSIRELGTPLEGTFDLSKCGNIGKYLSIATGYRKAKKPENENKVEIWIAPRFLIERELGTMAAHFMPIMDNWKQDAAPIGMFWTWGGWDDLGWYDYLTNESMENLSKMDLYVHFRRAIRSLDGHTPRLPKYTGGYSGRFSSFVCELSVTEK